MEKEKLKELVIKEIEAKKEELIKIGRVLYGMPETGFKEYKTSAYIKNILTDLGLEVQDKIALTGMKARLTGKNHLRS